MITQYKQFLSCCKTERECAAYTMERLAAMGFRTIDEVDRLHPGDKVMIGKMGKSVAAFVIGRQPLSEGMNILCAHIDSPRLDVKANPLFVSNGISFLNTHYYGGIRKYQWVTLPLALHGVVCRKDGSIVNIVIGEDDTDPVFCISDLLPHLAQDQSQLKASEFITGEELDIIVGNNPVSDGDNKETKPEDYVYGLLREKYGIEKDDFISAELEIVPAGKARDLGLDRKLILGYGQDDRSCAFASLEAFIGTANDVPERTSCIYLVDKEEIGSVGATGFHSNTFENMVAEIVDRCGDYSEITVRRALEHSNMLSSDVNAAYDPHHPEVFDTDNTCYLAKGITFCKFTGSRGKSGANDANPEYIAHLRNILDEAGCIYQMAELGKVDKGGGGTIAYLAARYGMNVIDIGLPILSMHAPWEIASVDDMLSAVKVYSTFLKKA